MAKSRYTEHLKRIALTGVIEHNGQTKKVILPHDNIHILMAVACVVAAAPAILVVAIHGRKASISHVDDITPDGVACSEAVPDPVEAPEGDPTTDNSDHR